MERTESINPELDKHTIKALVEHLANHKSCITYGDLSDSIEAIRDKPMHALGLAEVLGRIQDYCLKLRLPTLSALVVNQETEMPGDQFITRYRFNHPDAETIDEEIIVHAAQEACKKCTSWQELYRHVGLNEDAPTV